MRLVRWSAIGILLGCLGGLMAGCTESKVDRCNRLINTANEATQEIQALGKQSLKPADKFQKAAEILDRYTQKVQSLQMSDPHLQQFQQRLADLYAHDRDSNRTLAAPSNPQAVRQAAQSIQADSQAQQQLVQSVNQYCQAKS